MMNGPGASHSSRTHQLLCQFMLPTDSAKRYVFGMHGWIRTTPRVRKTIYNQRAETEKGPAEPVDPLKYPLHTPRYRNWVPEGSLA